MFYLYLGSLNALMGSLNVLLRSKNGLKCVKRVKNLLPSYFDTQYFTLVAMDNFNNVQPTTSRSTTSVL